MIQEQLDEYALIRYLRDEVYANNINILTKYLSDSIDIANINIKHDDFGISIMIKCKKNAMVGNANDIIQACIKRFLLSDQIAAAVEPACPDYKDRFIHTDLFYKFYKVSFLLDCNVKITI